MRTLAVSRGGTKASEEHARGAGSPQRHFQLQFHPSLRRKNWVNGEDCPHSWAEGARWGGWDSCYKDTQSGDPADSTHRTNLKDETGGAVSTGESRYLQDGGPREG